MKTRLLLLISAVLALSAVSRAQDTNNASTVFSKLGQGIAALGSSTNWGWVGYGTLGDKTDKSGHRAWGGGVLGLYSLNDFIALGGGVDGLTGLDRRGQATIISADIQARLPFHPLSGFSTNSFAQKFTMTPYLYTGTGTSFGSTINSTVIVHEGEGINFDVYSFGTWQIGAGFALIQRQNAGAYSGGYKDIVLSIHHPF